MSCVLSLHLMMLCFSAAHAITLHYTLGRTDVNGKVIHVVQRAPPSSVSSSTSDDMPPVASSRRHQMRHHVRFSPNVMVGSVRLPSNMVTHRPRAELLCCAIFCCLAGVHSRLFIFVFFAGQTRWGVVPAQ